ERWDPADTARYAAVLFPAMITRSSTVPAEPALLTVGISPLVQPLVHRVELTVSGRPLPMPTLKTYGPGWARVHTCLVGFTNPQDRTIHLRALNGDGNVVAERDIPLTP